MSRSLLDRFLPSWWRPQLTLHIYPDHIGWLCKQGLLKRQVTEQGIFHPESDIRDSKALLAMLTQVLQQLDVKGRRVNIVLSSHYVRYAMVTNPDGAAGSEELALLCRHAFSRVHGDAVDRWDIQLSLAALGGNGIASAIDRDLLNGLRQQIQQAGALLVSVQPALAHAFHALAKPAADGIFVLAEPERLTLLAWQESNWVAVQLQPASSGWQSGLDASLARLRLQLDMDDQVSVQVCVVGGQEIEPRLVPIVKGVEPGMVGGRA